MIASLTALESLTLAGDSAMDEGRRLDDHALAAIADQDRIASMKPGTGTTSTYAFDSSSNLTSLPPGATGTYDHDGELASSVLSGNTTSYTYNSDGERLSAVLGATTTASATWNGAASLTSYADSAANMTTASYDGDGLRQSSAVTPAGGSAAAQGYVWDTQAHIPQVIMDG